MPPIPTMFFRGDFQPCQHIEDIELVFMHDRSVGRLWIKNIDFERLQPGDKPRRPAVRLEDQSPGKGMDKIEVTAETAASGKHCLKIVDAPNLSRDWLPHVYYAPSYRDGVVTVRFALRIEPGAIADDACRGTQER